MAKSPFLSVAAFALVVLGFSIAADGQARKPSKAVKSPRTAWGAPDLQGVWDFGTRTPLERPDKFKGRAVLTAEEAAAQTQQVQAAESQASAPPRPAERNVGAYNSFWSDYGLAVGLDRRTSLITDPADGKLPPLQPGVEVQVGSAAEDLPGHRPVRYRTGGIGADGPEDRALAERCLVGIYTGPPVQPGSYNNNIQIFQSQDHVAILNEMVHDARMVPLDGRPHISSSIRQWMGDSRGRWDGDTLIVDTTNFTDKTAFNPQYNIAVGKGDTLHVIERFTRVSEDVLRYEFTIDDPKTFTRPFTAMIPMRRNPELMYEYACHEGNYGMVDMLSGARAKERRAAGAGSNSK